MADGDEPGEIEPIYKEIGERLAKLRRDQNLTQEALSAKADVSANYLARTERGFHRTNLGKLKAIADALDVALVSLFSDRPATAPEGVLPALADELAGLARDDQRLLLTFARRLKPTKQGSPKHKASPKKKRG